MRKYSFMEEASNYPQEYVERKNEIDFQYAQQLADLAKQNLLTAEELSTKKREIYNQRDEAIKKLNEEWQNSNKIGR